MSSTLLDFLSLPGDVSRLLTSDDHGERVDLYVHTDIHMILFTEGTCFLFSRSTKRTTTILAPLKDKTPMYAN